MLQTGFLVFHYQSWMVILGYSDVAPSATCCSGYLSCCVGTSSSLSWTVVQQVHIYDQKKKLLFSSLFGIGLHCSVSQCTLRMAERAIR